MSAGHELIGQARVGITLNDDTGIPRQILAVFERAGDGANPSENRWAEAALTTLSALKEEDMSRRIEVNAQYAECLAPTPPASWQKAIQPLGSANPNTLGQDTEDTPVSDTRPEDSSTKLVTFEIFLTDPDKEVTSFIIANEFISNSLRVTSAAPFLRALTQDIKKYIILAAKVK
ncbi:hypothetical protein Hte_009237 [Hypoxylon texense]